MSKWGWFGAGAVLVALVPILPAIVGAQDAEGFDAYIQSGTCAAPTDNLRVKLISDGDHDVAPYLAKSGDDDTVVLGYYGAPGAPGFGVSAIYADQQFSMVITDAEDGGAVACGDILKPQRSRFGRAGLAVVQLLPVEGSTVHGFAVIERAPMQRELDVTPTRVRVVLSTDASPPVTVEDVAGFDGYIQSGTCDAPTDKLRVQLRGRGDYDVRPFAAAAPGSEEAVTIAYYGAPLAPGFGLAAAYSDQAFSLVITGSDGGDPVACGDILEPDADRFAEAGRALVQLLPVGDAGVQGYAVIERLGMERELDITPTRVRILLFAPPASSS